MKFDIDITCCFTGHRYLNTEFSRSRLNEIIRELIDRGYKNFLVGMALGFDTEAFVQLQLLKNEYKDIKIVACIPCENQDKFFNQDEKNLYRKMINSSDEKIYVNKDYTAWCMAKRNRFMVDNSSVCVTFLRQKKGGTFYTYNYAKSKNKEIIEM